MVNLYFTDFFEWKSRNAPW